MHRSRTSRVLLTVLALAVALVWAFPVYWMLNSAFLPNVVLQSTTPTFLPVRRLPRQLPHRRRRPRLRSGARRSPSSSP